MSERDFGDSARFEGEVDLAAERPASTAHGLRPDRTMRWLVGGLVGGSLLLAAIVSMVRGGDDDEATHRNPDVALVERQLEPPLVQAIIALELVRMEAITAHAVRAMGDAPPHRELARRPSSPVARTTGTPVHTTVKPPRATAEPSPTVRELPVPQVDAPVEPAAPPPDAPALPSVSDDDGASAVDPDDRS